MAGDVGVADWVAGKLQDDQSIISVTSIGAGFLEIQPKKGPAFIAAALGVKDTISRAAVRPLFEVKGIQPQFVVNVPSKVIWSGEAIEIIHSAPAAFGTLGELTKAAREESVFSYRNREYNFFDDAFRQHSAVRDVTRLFDKVFLLHRYRGLKDVTVVLVDAYDLSAEDIRNSRKIYGKFDAAVKMSSYGSITTAALEAAESIGAEAFKFGDLLRRLNKP